MAFKILAPSYRARLQASAPLFAAADEAQAAWENADAELTAGMTEEEVVARYMADPAFKAQVKALRGAAQKVYEDAMREALAAVMTSGQTPARLDFETLRRGYAQAAADLRSIG